jgi:hypothetical protein
MVSGLTRGFQKWPENKTWRKSENVLEKNLAFFQTPQRCPGTSFGAFDKSREIYTYIYT